MSVIVDWTPGGFAYLRGGQHPFSNGVVAADGFVFTRVRFRHRHPLAEGLAIAADFLDTQNRPPGAFAACELRAPAPLPGAEFAAFNAEYRTLLRANGFGADDAFPIARSNLAPLYDPPATAVLFAFTYSVRAQVGGGARDFVLSGLPELVGDPPAIVARGDVSPAGLERKAGAVVAELRERVERLGAAWSGLTGAQVYSVHSLDAVRDVLGRSGMAGPGLTFFPAYPPVTGLDFEADVRAVTVERVL